MAFAKGHKINNGRKPSDSHRRKISIANKLALKGNKNHLGKKHSDKSKRKMSLSHLKNPSRYWLGKNRDKETKNKISANLLNRFTGKDSPLWRGGRKNYTVDWNETLKRSIRERDKYRCRICGEPQGEELLSIHHIDYNTHNCSPDNLITLCRRCHCKTNHHREYWINYFKNIWQN